MPEYQSKACPLLTAGTAGAAGIIHCASEGCQWWGFCKLAPLVGEALQGIVDWFDWTKDRVPQADVTQDEILSTRATRRAYAAGFAKGKEPQAEAVPPQEGADLETRATQLVEDIARMAAYWLRSPEEKARLVALALTALREAEEAGYGAGHGDGWQRGLKHGREDALDNAQEVLENMVPRRAERG